MRFVQLDEKNEERMNAIRKFTLMDDTFMTQVFSGDKESTSVRRGVGFLVRGC